MGQLKWKGRVRQEFPLVLGGIISLKQVTRTRPVVIRIVRDGSENINEAVSGEDARCELRSVEGGDSEELWGRVVDVEVTNKLCSTYKHIFIPFSDSILPNPNPAAKVWYYIHKTPITNRKLILCKNQVT